MIIDKLKDKLSRTGKGGRAEALAYVGIMIAAIVIFVLSGGISCFGSRTEETSNVPKETERPADEEDLERRLESILSGIKGAGRVDVMLTFDTQLLTGAQDRQGSDKPADTAGSSADPSGEALSAGQRVRGVIVVAEGASDIKVMNDLRQAVMTVLGVGITDICVYAMQK